MWMFTLVAAITITGKNLSTTQFMQPVRFRQADLLLVEINTSMVHESSLEFGGGALAPFPKSSW